jgi:predicted negative regulator of RcsB-dependent stress response
MAKHLDLEEQEQLDELKHFWKTYGNLITWILIAVLGSFLAWYSYQSRQASQATQAAALFDEVDRSASAGDLARLERSLKDMKDKFGGTTYASQAALLAGKVFFETDKTDAAKDALRWVAETSSDDAYRAVAKLRLASVLIGQKAYDEASKLLAGTFPKDFEALVADRKGDIASLQAKKPDAIAEYQKAYRLFDGRTDYRRLVEVKLNALGVDPLVAAAQAANAVATPPSGDPK